VNPSKVIGSAARLGVLIWPALVATGAIEDPDWSASALELQQDAIHGGGQARAGHGAACDVHSRSMSSAGASMEGIGQKFIDAFNRRDADDLVALADQDIEFHPTTLVGRGKVYHGHDGLRRWVEELGTSQIKHQIRVREVRALDERRLLILSEVLLDGEFVSPSATVARLTDKGRIAEAHAYLTDEHMLMHIGVVPKRSADPA
jgi:hypothetical protein